MSRFKKRLEIGEHVLALPLAKIMPLAELFPKEITGSTIEKLDGTGYWEDSETILYENGSLSVAKGYRYLSPFDTVRLNLKRPITIDWRVAFRSYSGIEEASIKFEEGFDYKEALYFAELSNLVYEEESFIKSMIERRYKFDKFYYCSKQSHNKLSKKGIAELLMMFFRGKKSIVDLQFMHLSREDKESGKELIVIVFRGSQEPQDWMTNFNLNEEDFHARGKVHQGFKEALKLFLETMKTQGANAQDFPLSLLDIERINKNTEIILTGHSLGGALATLAGCQLYEMGIAKENLEVYTFGAPPVGTERFCNYYNDKLNIYRLVNEEDVVPKLDKITSLFHISNKIELPSNEGEVHACQGYIDNIIDAMER